MQISQLHEYPLLFLHETEFDRLIKKKLIIRMNFQIRHAGLSIRCASYVNDDTG